MWQAHRITRGAKEASGAERSAGDQNRYNRQSRYRLPIVGDLRLSWGNLEKGSREAANRFAAFPRLAAMHA